MTRWLQSGWFAALVGCLIYLAVTAVLMPPAKFQGLLPPTDIDSHDVSMDEPSWKFRNPEFDQWVDEIKRERDALNLREQQLQELQTRLESERQELNSTTQLVHQLQADFDKNVVRIGDQEVDNLKRQAKVISGMSPEGAASLLNEITEDDAVRILVTMKADEASAVLEALTKIGKPEARRAAALTERMRRALPPETGARTRSSS